MQVFINISSKVAFILKSYVRQPSRVYPNFHGVPFPPRSQLLPGTGSNKLQFFHSAEVSYFSHERSTPCCTTGQLTRPQFHVVGPSRWSKPITALSTTSYVCTILRDVSSSLSPLSGRLKPWWVPEDSMTWWCPGNCHIKWTIPLKTTHR